MKYLIEGRIEKQDRSFRIEVEAKSEKHAKDLIMVKLGGASALRKSEISILKVEHKK
jgi:ribosomal protein L20A (L18A)